MSIGLTSNELSNTYFMHLKKRIEGAQANFQSMSHGESPSLEKEFSELIAITPSDMNEQTRLLCIFLGLVKDALLDTIDSNNQALSKAITDIRS